MATQRTYRVRLVVTLVGEAGSEECERTLMLRASESSSDLASRLATTLERQNGVPKTAPPGWLSAK